jgi:myo-inositol-1(or 4)-monophosphatase
VPGGLLRWLPVSDPEALLRIAVNAAGEAGRLLASWRGDERPEVVDTKSSPTDVVTEMDRRSEALITEWIRAVRPGDTVLGEEGGQTLGGPDAVAAAGDQARVRWVVDPLDGTVNYLYGLPDWAVSIAAEVDGTILAGVVEVPRFGERFTAIAGRGAWLHRDENPAAAAVDLCSVAAGRMDAFFERGLNYWDYAAGGLIAREAGALVGGLSGRTESTSMTVAASPDLFRHLDTFLTELDPERDAPRGREPHA